MQAACRVLRYGTFLLALAGMLWQPVSSVQAGAIVVGHNVAITDAGLNGSNLDGTDVVAQDDTIYAVWGDGRDDNTFDNFRQIYFAKSTDRGQTWSANVRVGKVDYDDWGDHPQIAVGPDGIIWITWYLFYKPNSNQVNEIRIAKSVDGGQTFTVSTVVDGFESAEDRWRPHVAVDPANGRVILLYNEYWELGGSVGYDLYVNVYDQNLQLVSHTTINDQPRVGRLGEGNQDNSVPLKSLVASSGKVCAAWEDQRNRFAIWGACSSDGGKTFGANFPLSDADAISPRLDIGADGLLYAIYVNKNDDHKNVLFRYSDDNGATWSPSTSVTRLQSSEAKYWDLAVDVNGQIVVSWVRELLSSASDLYLSTSLDKGKSWSQLAVEDGTGEYPSSADQWDVSLAVTGRDEATTAHLVWEDSRNTSPEIFGANFVLDGIPPSTPQNLEAIGGDTSIRLMWEAATDTNGVQGYRIFRSTDPNGTYAQVTPVIVPVTSYRDVELDDTLYYYRVAAVDSTGNMGALSARAEAQATVGTDLPVEGTIAYVVNEELRLRDFADFAVERTLGQGGRPRFSPDGSRIYYEANSTISSQSVAGGDVKLIYTAENLFDDYDIASFDPVDNANNEKYIAAIIGRSLIQVDGSLCAVSEPHYLVSTEKRYIDDYNYSAEIALSAFPQWMVYRYTGFCNTVGFGSTTPGDLCIVNLSNNEKNCLKGADYRDADFAPTRDDSRIAFAAPISGQYEIWVAEIDENGNFGNYIQLTHGADGVVSRAPNWSSNGNWIIFERDVDPSQLQEIQLHIVRADGSSLRNLGITGRRPAWSAQGEPGPAEVKQLLYLPAIKK